MIDAKLLQSFMSDMERLRSNSSSSANNLALSAGAKSAPSEPFTEILAKTLDVLKENQAQGDVPVSGAINSRLQLIDTDMLNVWLNYGNNRNGSAIGENEGIDTPFPESASKFHNQF